MVENNNSSRELQELIKDFHIVESNKLNITQAKLILIGLLFELIQRRDLFKRNSHLKEFTDVVIVPYSIEKESFKEYLFNSRTLLAARIGKIILDECKYTDLLKIVNTIILSYEEQTNLTNSSKKYSIDDEIIKWMRFIGDNE